MRNLRFKKSAKVCEISGRKIHENQDAFTFLDHRFVFSCRFIFE